MSFIDTMWVTINIIIFLAITPWLVMIFIKYVVFIWDAFFGRVK